MMEAYSSVYKTEEKEVISEETQELEENRNQRGAAARANRQAAAAAAAAQGNSGGPTSPSGGALSMRDRIFARRSASPAAQANTNRVGQNIKVGSPTGPAQNQLLKKPAPLTAQQKAYGPNSTLNKDQQAVNREYDRLRAKDPEAALAYGKKMASKGAARSDFKIEKPTQAQSNPTAAQKQARVDAAIKSVNTPEKMNKTAPVGSALRAQQDKQAAAKAAANAPRPMARPGARNADRAPGGMASGRPAPKPVAGGSTAVGSAAAKPTAPVGGYQLPAGARPVTAPRPTGARPMGARNRMRMEELDIFDTIKEYLIDEGATEEEALKQMLTLTDEQRTEILEGSCGSKKKKKSKKGGYGK